MEPTVEKEFTAYGGLFQNIISDLKSSAPVWEDFLMKATKFHSQLKATVGTSSSFLDAFQKIADMATNTRGATKEIGSALTRLCLRQRSVESKLKTFSNSLLESLIIPLQEKVEEWKKISNHLDKEHAKECKRAKQELKKKSSDTLRLQKKVRKVGVVDIRRTLDYALQDVTDMYLLLEETEKQSIRKALIEERSHFCIFVGYLYPVLESEIKMINEISHLEEVMDTLSKITGDPHLLPTTSEQVIIDMKSSSNAWSFRSPPSSPGSLGSRKSSVCSISSVNSSSSGSLKGQRQLSYCQYATVGNRYNSVTSQDSGFASQDTLSSFELQQLSSFSEAKPTTLSTPSSPLPSVTSTWPNLQETEPFEAQPTNQLLKYQRPHTISSAYEKNSHNRPALTARTFEPLDCAVDPRISYATVGTFKGKKFRNHSGNHSQPGTPICSRPTIPERNEDVTKEKPSVPEKSRSVRAKTHKSMPDFNRTPPDQVVPHPVYANTNELGAKTEGAGSSGDSKEIQSRRDLANVLTEGLLLQSKKMRNENPAHSGVLTKPTNSQQLIGISETLPRSKEIAIEEAEIMQWQMYSLSLYNANCYFVPTAIQRRPASVAGVAESLQLPRKANTLQRVASTPGNKPPPTPVRRSSSITAPSNTSNGSIVLKSNGSSSSISSGGGEVCYSPNYKQMSKSSTIPENVMSRGRSYSPLRHVKRDRNLERDGVISSSSSNNVESDSDKGIVTDVSDSRARLIQDLNSTIQQNRKLSCPKQFGHNDPPPAVPPRHSSRQEQWEARREKEMVDYSNQMVENTLGGKLEKRGQVFNAKPVLCQNISKTIQRKPSVHGFSEQSGDLTASHHSNPQQPVPPNDSEKHFKHTFMAALNAKLAQHQQNSYPKPHDTEKHSVHSLYRESLMDQIKKGTTLRRVICNDRSLPRLA